jgi:hypothetical protein
LCGKTAPCNRPDTTSVHSVGNPARTLNPGRADEVARCGPRGLQGRALGRGRLAARTEAPKRVEHVHEAFRLCPCLGPVVPNLGTELAHHRMELAQDPGVLVDRHGERSAHIAKVAEDGAGLLPLALASLEVALDGGLVPVALLAAEPELLADALHQLVAAIEMAIDARESLASGEHELMIARRPDRQGALS